MTFNLVLVDDQDRTTLPALIERICAGDFEVIPLAPPIDLDMSPLLDADADLFLVDYELDTKQENGTFAPYLGMTLAARIREIKPDLPIVLLTRSNLGKWTQMERTVLTGAAFDDIMFKDTELETDADGTHARLVSLARGYQTLRSTPEHSASALLELLDTDEAGQRYALEALPPGDGWRVFEVAHWLRSVLLRYPGVLYDDLHAATALGISLESFRQHAVQVLLQPATYRGPFSEEQQRWWRHSLFNIASRLCASIDPARGVREGFRLAAGQSLDLELDPSADEETGSSPADTVCHVLGVPVRIETSLPYQPDARPPVMEEARVSFRAIRESNEVEEMYVEAASRARLEEIRAAI